MTAEEQKARARTYQEIKDLFSLNIANSTNAEEKASLEETSLDETSLDETSLDETSLEETS